MRKKQETLEATLLQCAHTIAEKEGVEAISIRRLAVDAGIATGTVYLYFTDKEEVLLALTEAYWRQTLLDMRETLSATTFCGQVSEIFSFLRARMVGRGGELMRSLSGAEFAGRERMRAVQNGLREALLRRIREDSQIRPDVWTSVFTPENYADFVLMNLLLLLQKNVDCISFFLDMIQRTLY